MSFRPPTVHESPTSAASLAGVHCSRVHHSRLMATAARPQPFPAMVPPWAYGTPAQAGSAW